MDAQEQKAELAQKVLQMKEEEKLRKERDAATLGLASSAVKALENANAPKASDKVVSNIAKILSSQSGSAPESSQIASAIVSAIKSAAQSALSS